MGAAMLAAIELVQKIGFSMRAADGIARPFPIPSRVAYEIVMACEARRYGRPAMAMACPCRAGDVLMTVMLVTALHAAETLAVCHRQRVEQTLGASQGGARELGGSSRTDGRSHWNSCRRLSMRARIASQARPMFRDAFRRCRFIVPVSGTAWSTRSDGKLLYDISGARRWYAEHCRMVGQMVRSSQGRVRDVVHDIVTGANAPPAFAPAA